MNEIGIQTEPMETVAHQDQHHRGHKIPEFHHLPKDIQGICKAILLSICISANLGGTGTLTGTGPNLVLSGQLQQLSIG